MSDPILICRLTVDGDAQWLVIGNDAPSLHAVLGGFMEVIYLPRLTTDPMNSIIGLVDEDGWRDQARAVVNPYSMVIYGKPIAGAILLVRAAPDGEFISLTDSDQQCISTILDAVGVIIYSVKES